MTQHPNRKARIRAYAAEHGLTYQQALQALERLDNAGRVTSPAAAAALDPQLLAPYPDELVRPADAGDDWQPVTTDELGWRVLPADATPAQRARAESIWRPVATDRPCRCAGKCWHGKPCDDGTDGPVSCDGLLVHHDRLAVSLLSLTGWFDVYACDTCGEQETADVDLPGVPWGEATDTGARQFDGIRRVNFHEDADGGCPDCGAEPGYRCACDDRCEECGADANNPYACSCDEYERV